MENTDLKITERALTSSLQCSTLHVVQFAVLHVCQFRGFVELHGNITIFRITMPYLYHVFKSHLTIICIVTLFLK